MPVTWVVNCTKENGQPRKHFKSFVVEKNIRDNLGLKDGDVCNVSVILGRYTNTGFRSLSSGREVLFPVEVSRPLAAYAKTHPGANIIFTLSKVISQEADDTALSAAIKKARALSPQERARGLNGSDPMPLQTWAITKVFSRNPLVIAEVLDRSKGRCERCKKKAPFIRATNGEPYLEVHHRTRLADGGRDTVGHLQ